MLLPTNKYDGKALTMYVALCDATVKVKGQSDDERNKTICHHD